MRHRCTTADENHHFQSSIESAGEPGTGTKVVTRDDHAIGILHTVEIDADGKPTGIVVATGLLHRDHRAIPLAQIRSADAKQIVLTMTRDAYEGMAV